jgi:YfiH family protein
MSDMYLQASSLAALPGIHHAFFTRNGGVSGGIYESLNGGVGSKDAADHVGENRARMENALGVARGYLVSCYQIHSPNVIVAEKPWTRAEAPRADAIVTRTPGLAVGVATADCGPILFADGEASVVGAAHSGWKGAIGGVLEAAIESMEKLGARRERIVAALGPMISQPSYEVGAEFVAQFTAHDLDNARFFVSSPREGHAQFDLPGYIAMRLTRAGVAHVEDLKACTYANADRFYSYRRSTHRREPDYGRHINAIAITG